MGKIGSAIVGLLLDAGHEVVGVETDLKHLALLQENIILPEPGVSDLLSESNARLRLVNSGEMLLRDCDVIVIIVPTPSLPTGAFSNQALFDAIESLGPELSLSEKRQTVVIASTVMPETCALELVPLLKKSSGKDPYSGEIGLVYSPQFIALGNVIRNLRLPDFVLVGESEPWAGDMFIELWESVLHNKAPFLKMSLASAEITKLAVNTFVTTKISFANMVGSICDNIEGADRAHVLKAVGADSRIGSSYLAAGLGYGGPCFPRDNRALAQAASARGISASIALATDEINSFQVSRVLSKITDLTDQSDRILMIGMAYKPGTPVIEASQAVQIASELSAVRRVAVTDAFATAEELIAKGLDWTPYDSIDLASFDRIVLCHPRDGLDLGNIELSGKIIDLWS